MLHPAVIFLNTYYQKQLILMRARNVIQDSDSLYHSPVFWTYICETLIVVFHVPPGLDYAIGTENGLEQIFVTDILSVLIFGRLYLVVRMLRDNSRLLSAGGLLLGSLANVEITWSFVMKTILEEHATTVLFTMLLAVAFITSYVVHVLERGINPEVEDLDDALWLTFVTLTTVGYGDVTPDTHLGRFVVFVGAICGVFLTALMFAITHRHMQHSNVETRVVNFFRWDGINKMNVDMACRVIQKAWRLRSAVKRFEPGHSRRVKAVRHLARSIKAWVDFRRKIFTPTLHTQSLSVEMLYNGISGLTHDLVWIDKRLNEIEIPSPPATPEPISTLPRHMTRERRGSVYATELNNLVKQSSVPRPRGAGSTGIAVPLDAGVKTRRVSSISERSDEGSPTSGRSRASSWNIASVERVSETATVVADKLSSFERDFKTKFSSIDAANEQADRILRTLQATR
eukprot:TRINITY_DN9441_c0_g1_i1.p1 TRINITY_DN9441_c0_g1~~TRINITY_DN9441_c0_g1_i1.p1  ORF type:complete len:500 (-),score=28.67 TRINITY_DN9441_c0_g1_i1:137-1507(-)